MNEKYWRENECEEKDIEEKEIDEKGIEEVMIVKRITSKRDREFEGIDNEMIKEKMNNSMKIKLVVNGSIRALVIAKVRVPTLLPRNGVECEWDAPSDFAPYSMRRTE